MYLGLPISKKIEELFNHYSKSKNTNYACNSVSNEDKLHIYHSMQNKEKPFIHQVDAPICSFSPRKQNNAMSIIHLDTPNDQLTIENQRSKKQFLEEKIANIKRLNNISDNIELRGSAQHVDLSKLKALNHNGNIGIRKSYTDVYNKKRSIK